MVETLEANIHEDITKSLKNLKKDIMANKDIHSETEEKIDLDRMINHGGTFGLKSGGIGGFLSGQETRTRPAEFTRILSRAIGRESNAITGNVPYQLEPMYYKPGYTPMPRGSNKPLTPNNITKAELKNNFDAFKEKITDRGNSENQEYVAKIIAGILLKNKDMGCLKVSGSTLEIYDPSNERMEGGRCFNIQGTEASLNALLSKTFEILSRRDTITDVTDETLDYLIELGYKQRR